MNRVHHNPKTARRLKMVTFTFGDREAEMFLGPTDPYEKTSRLRWGYNGFDKAYSGGQVMEFLAEKWDCNPEDIKHDLPSEITTPEQELDFAMFYDGHPMAIRVPGAMDKLVWCGWTYKSNTTERDPGHRFMPFKSWNEPLWRDVITKVEFEARPEYYANALKRIMDADDKVGVRIADGWKMVDRNGLSYVHVEIWANHLTTFRVVEGEMRDGGFHARRLTGEKLKVRIPFPHDATRAMKIVEEEKIKAIKQMMPKLFGKNTDVALIHNYRDSILYGLDQLPQGEIRRYEILWTRNNSALMVRIPESGTIRCPVEYRGHVLGHNGGTIKALAQKHGHRYLKVV
jgi:hypothetical protein